MKEYEDIYLEDNNNIASCDSVNWNDLDNSTIMVTGATGLIGTTLIRGLMERNQSLGGQLKVLALVRNEEKGRKIFL